MNSSSKIRLADFKSEISKTLCKSESGHLRKRGRRSTETEKLVAEKRRWANASHLPPMNVRLDAVGHFPELKVSRMENVTSTL